MSLTSFELWGGAKDRAKMLTYEEIERIGEVIEELYEEIEDVAIKTYFGSILVAWWTGSDISIMKKKM